jgi:uncharacterized membrane protein (DUF4010 family)
MMLKGTMQLLAPEWIAMGESLLIGLIVGVERESDAEERHAGLRDFVSIGLAGGLCGILGQAWITVAALAALTAMLVVFRLQTPGRTGITTEMVAVVTFLLCVLTATPAVAHGSALAIALTVILALFLDARDALRRFAREVLTDQEYWDTLRFLAVVFVILPVLPEGAFGPYGFLNPRRIWMFVILVSSISFLGYFLQRFLGASQGLRLTAVLGGIGSTTAATLAFARQAGEQPDRWRQLAAAAVLANVVLNPRVLVLLWLAGGPLLTAAWPALLAMLTAGLLFSAWLARSAGEAAAHEGTLALGNPFRLGPAVQFGALFVVVRLAARWATAEFGAQGAVISSALGGSADVDAVAFSLAGVLRDGQLTAQASVLALLAAIAANAAVKTALAYASGGRAFGRVVLAGFAVMFSAAVAVTLALA